MAGHPEYFSSLRPFKKLFRLGTAILTYHKLGPRPANARLKGMYLGEDYFRKQLNSLREAQFTPSTLDDLVRAHDTAQGGIIITFDDAYSNVLRYGLPPLVETGFTAIQFVVADLIGKTNIWDTPNGEVQERLMDKVQIKEWIAEGQMIGSHTLSHPWLGKMPNAIARDEIYASKARLEDMFGVPVEHFCYPYGNWSPSVMEYVRQAGYKTACTVENGINLPETPRYALRRFTARYPSRNLKAWWRRLHSWWDDLHSRD